MADQVSRLYELIAGYHATNLLEIARELGVWEALARRPGRTSEELATQLGTQPFYTDVLCRTAFSFGLLDRDGAGWRMAPHFDQILGNPESSFYLACAPRVHMVVGDDYPQYAGRFRDGTTTPYQQHDEAFMREVAEALKALPRIFLDLVLPRLPASVRGWRRAAGCWTSAAAAAGRWCSSPSGSPARPVSGSTWSRTRSSWRGG
jgi:hypothetical protein